MREAGETWEEGAWQHPCSSPGGELGAEVEGAPSAAGMPLDGDAHQLATVLPPEHVGGRDVTQQRVREHISPGCLWVPGQPGVYLQVRLLPRTQASPEGPQAHKFGSDITARSEGKGGFEV